MFGKKPGRRVQVISAHGQAWRDDDYDDDEYEDYTPSTRQRKSTQSGRCMICSAIYARDDGIKKHHCIMCRKHICSRCCTGVDPVCTECMPAAGGGKVANFVAPPARRPAPSKSPRRNMSPPLPPSVGPSPMRQAPQLPPGAGPKRQAPPLTKKVSKKNQVKKQGSLFGFGRKSPRSSPPKDLDPPAKKSFLPSFGRKSPGSSPPKEAPKRRMAPPMKKSPPPSPLPSKAPPKRQKNGKASGLEGELQKLMADTAGRNPTIGERNRIKELMLQLKDDGSEGSKPRDFPSRAPAAAFKKPPAFKKPAPSFPVQKKAPPAFNKKPAPSLKQAPRMPPTKPASKPWNKKPAPTFPPKKPASKTWNKKSAPKKPASRPAGRAPPKFNKPSVPKSNPGSKRTSKTFKLGTFQKKDPDARGNSAFAGTRGKIANSPFLNSGSAKKANTVKKKQPPKFKSPFAKKPPPKPAGGVKTGSVKDAIARRNRLDKEARAAPKPSANRWN